MSPLVVISSAASQANQAVCTVFHDYRDQLVLAIRNPFRLLAPLCSSEVISPADRDELLNCTDADDFNMSIKLINAVEVTMRAAPRALLVMQKFYQVITHTTAAVDLNMVKSIMPKSELSYELFDPSCLGVTSLLL